MIELEDAASHHTPDFIIDEGGLKIRSYING